jgi:hypothetical protein
MDHDGNVLVEHEGDRSVAKLEETGKKVPEQLELRKKAAAGDKDAKVKIAFADLEAGRMKGADAKKMLEGITLTDEQKAQLEKALVNAEVREIQSSYHPTDQASFEKANEEITQKFLERLKAGKPLPTGEMECQTFWVLLMRHAEKTNDVKLYEQGCKALEARFGNDARFKNGLERMKKKLETMQKAADKKADDKRPDEKK